jgi:hypothetical protein
MLSIKNQVLLKSVARSNKDPRFGEVNEALNEAIERIKQEEPQEFLNDRDLGERTFYDEPLSSKRGNFRMKGFIVPLPEQNFKI